MRLPRAPSELWLVAGFKSLVSLLVLAAGFRALSDDDYARVHIAQSFAQAPSFDPSGTSWLPLPFWLTGAAMALLGTDPIVARVVAVASGVLGIALLWAAARALGVGRQGALLGATIAAAFPYSAWLGVATVPELLTASLIVFALATAASPNPTQRLAGGVLLAAAALSRYEAWPVVLGLAALGAWDALRHRDLRRLLPAVIAALGPLSWLVSGLVRHGSAFFFVKRVAAYHAAVGGDARPAWERLLDKPIALVRCEPELMALLVVLLLAQLSRGTAPLGRYARVGLGLGALLAFLMIGDVRGAAPTHHAERTLLACWLAAALLVGDLACSLRVRLSPLTRRLTTLGALTAVLCAALFARPWYARRDGFIDRSDHVALGRAARAAAPGRVLLVSTPDYGYYSVFTGYGSPESSLAIGGGDPRLPPRRGAPASPAEFMKYISNTGAHWLVVTGDEQAALARRAGATPWAARGELSLLRAPGL